MFLLLLIYGGVFAISALSVISFLVFFMSQPYPLVIRYKEEEFFEDENKQKVKFPARGSAHSINLSVIVPAYNEETRLPPMLDECLGYLDSVCKSTPNFKYEVIVVSDGSKDKTMEVVKRYTASHGSEKVRSLNLIKNRGKGGAVRLGVQNARGALILFADADGATKFSDISKLEKKLSDLIGVDCLRGNDEVAKMSAIAIGSRAHLEDEAIASRSFFRTILMYGFHFLVWLFTVRGIRDTQCGFKLLTRKAAAECFGNLHVERWAFDVELLYIAQKLNIPIAEEAVNWTEIEGSKVTPVWSWIQMGYDLALIWLHYRIGAWKLLNNKKE